MVPTFLKVFTFASAYLLLPAWATRPSFKMARGLAAEDEADACLPCDMIFTNVKTAADGRRVQIVDMTERGEPKSGTGFMFQWARRSLDSACDFLKHAYGAETCRSEKSTDHPSMNHTLTFDPHLAGPDAKCPCDGVDLVWIHLSQHHKHDLPVDEDCIWHRGGGFYKEGAGCLSSAGRPVEGYVDIWSCIREAQCKIQDDRLQMIAMRDPRAVAVSTYFHMIRFNNELPRPGEGLDENVLAILPRVCHWVAVRHILFAGLMAERSVFFWYDDAKDPPKWFTRFLSSVGVHIPGSEVSKCAMKASSKGKLNEHPGGEDAVATRTWMDEISPDYVDEINAIVRRWLPPTLLARLEVPP